MITFNEIVWNNIQADRENACVVDNTHAYGIIVQATQKFCDKLNSLTEDDDQSVLLPLLVDIAVAAQSVAENLCLVDLQQDNEHRYAEAERKTAELSVILEELVTSICTKSVKTKSLQIGKPRFSFEFDKQFMDKIKDSIDSI